MWELSMQQVIVIDHQILGEELQKPPRPVKSTVEIQVMKSQLASDSRLSIDGCLAKLPLPQVYHAFKDQMLYMISQLQ